MNIEIKKSIKPVNYFDALNLMEDRLCRIFDHNDKGLIWTLEHEKIYTAGTGYIKTDIIDKSIKIIEQNSSQTTTEEIISFSTVIKNEISQKTVHQAPKNNEMLSEIISGPAKGTTILAKFKKISEGTEIQVNIELKLSLKAKILSPIIKKLYKNVLMGIFYKINNMALQSEKS